MVFVVFDGSVHDRVTQPVDDVRRARSGRQQERRDPFAENGDFENETDETQYAQKEQTRYGRKKTQFTGPGETRREKSFAVNEARVRIVTTVSELAMMNADHLFMVIPA